MARVTMRTGFGPALTAMLGLVVVGLAGCGVRGDLKPPTSVRAEPVAAPGQGPVAVEAERKREGFILDPLL